MLLTFLLPASLCGWEDRQAVGSSQWCLSPSSTCVWLCSAPPAVYSFLQFLKKLVQQSPQQTAEATDASGSAEGPSLGKNPGTRLELHGCDAGKRKRGLAWWLPWVHSSDVPSLERVKT